MRLGCTVAITPYEISGLRHAAGRDVHLPQRLAVNGK
jgi:hypothetical protein